MVHLGADRWSAWPDNAEESLGGGEDVLVLLTLSICSCHVEGPCLEVMAIVFFFPWGCIIRKTNFPILEMSLLHCFTVTKEMAVGGATSDILYNLFPKVIITTLCLNSYIACRFHKYVCPNNTSQTSRGAMSHNTSSVKGLMLYGLWHYWLTRRSLPWWSHLMVYGCGCVVVGKPNSFMTSTKMGFFWLPFLTTNCSGNPFTHIWEWKRCSSSFRSSGSSF